MKKLLLIIVLIGLVLSACGQAQTFNKIIIANKGIQFVDGTIQNTAYTGQTGTGSVEWANILNKPTTFTPSVHNQTWSTITSRPTTLSGYGITDAALSTHNHSTLYKPLSYVPTWNEITLKPLFATVATTGSYVDLLNKPATEDLGTAIVQYAGEIEGYTTTQINALNPAKCKIVLDTTLGVLKVYVNGTWRVIILSE